MANSAPTSGSGPRRPQAQARGASLVVSPEHYLRLIWHRKWLVLAVWVVVSAATYAVVQRLPDVYQSETVILVDPQKVPESYVKATITGDVRNRLGTLSQQILSATRLQKIIDNLNLYSEDRKTRPREDIIMAMRRHVNVNLISDYGTGQDLQAFKISFSGPDPRVAAQVANELASLFIEENLKAREQQATGTTEFLQNQMQEARKTLEAQEAKLAAYRSKHVGEMPEHEVADLQILGQLRSQLQLESEGLARSEQQRNYLHSLMIQPVTRVVDLDEPSSAAPAPGTARPGAPSPAASRSATKLAGLRAGLAVMQERYGDTHPAIRKLKQEIEDEELKEVAAAAPKPPQVETVPAASGEAPAAPSRPASTRIPPPVQTTNPVLQSQLKGVEEEISRRKLEQQRLNKLVGSYQAKLEAIPMRQQQIADLVRDYEISKAHYQKLLDNQLSAETATQLEIRQKGEKFSILDPAQPAEKPTQPNRPMMNAGGSAAGLGIGLLLALLTEFIGMCITAPEQITEISGVPVLEVIPVIRTHRDRRARRQRLFWAAVSGIGMAALACVAVLIYRYRS